MHYVAESGIREKVAQTEIEGMDEEDHSMDEDDHSSTTFMTKLNDWVSDTKRLNPFEVGLGIQWELISERDDRFISPPPEPPKIRNLREDEQP